MVLDTFTREELISAFLKVVPIFKKRAVNYTEHNVNDLFKKIKDGVYYKCFTGIVDGQLYPSQLGEAYRCITRSIRRRRNLSRSSVSEGCPIRSGMTAEVETRLRFLPRLHFKVVLHCHLHCHHRIASTFLPSHNH